MLPANPGGEERFPILKLFMGNYFVFPSKNGLELIFLNRFIRRCYIHGIHRFYSIFVNIKFFDY